MPFLDNFISMTSDRLLKHKNLLNSFSCLFSNKNNNIIDNFENCIKHSVQIYSQYLLSFSPNLNYCRITFKLHTITANVSGLIKHCAEISHPNIYKILTIVDTIINITTVTAERSFSTLRRLKTYLRNTMKANCLNGLAQL